MKILRYVNQMGEILLVGAFTSRLYSKRRIYSSLAADPPFYVKRQLFFV